MSTRAGHLMLLTPLTILLAAFAAVSCSGGQKNLCDPTTIVVEGKCYWDKQQACDAISCIPPDECVVVDGSPSQVECNRVETVPTEGSGTGP